jgi:hypothetical protein
MPNENGITSLVELYEIRDEYIRKIEEIKLTLHSDEYNQQWQDLNEGLESTNNLIQLEELL